MESGKLLLALVSFIACVSLIDGGKCPFNKDGACDCDGAIHGKDRREVREVSCNATTGFPHFTKRAFEKRYNVLRMTITGNLSVIPKKAFAAFRNIDNLILEHTAERQHQSWDATAFQGVKVRYTLRITNLDGVIPIPKAVEALYTISYPGLSTLSIDGGGEVSLRAKSFGNVYKLGTLTIQRTTILSIDRDAFDGLSNLKDLTITDGHEITLPAECFRSLWTLKSLTIKRTKIWTIDPNAFAGLRNLENLTLESTSLTQFPQAAMDHLRSLRGIVLSGNHFKSPTVPGLQYLPRNVYTCNLDNNGLTAFPTELIRTNQHLNFLSLAHNNISSLNITDVSYLYNGIEKLDLSGNPITFIDLGGKLRNLRTLHLPQQKLSHVDLSAFRRTEMEILDMDNFPNLKSIFMSAEAPPLKSLYFTNTGLERIDPSVAGLFDGPGMSMFINQNKHFLCDEGIKVFVERMVERSIRPDDIPRLFVGGSFCADKNISLDKYILDIVIASCKRLWNSRVDMKEWCISRLNRFILNLEQDSQTGFPEKTLIHVLADKAFDTIVNLSNQLE